MDLYKHTRQAANAILNQTYKNIELILVSDGNEEVCEAMHADYSDHHNVKVGCNNKNRGLSYSRNKGIELASGDVVAFVDDDAIPESEWLKNLVAGYDRHDAIAVGGKMTPIWVDGKPRYLPEEFYWLVGVTHRGYPEKECKVRNTNGSNMSFKREVLEELGGFDENLGRKGDQQIQGEETELTARLREEYGEGMWYVPEAKVGHKIFDYRTDRKWLLVRAFWQGYSKRIMDDLVDDTGGQEGKFLRDLVLRFGPGRLAGLLRSPSKEKVDQLAMLVSLTAAVSFGFLYGLLRY